MMCKRKYFTKLIYKGKFSNMVQNNYNTKISMIQQHGISILEIHAGHGLEIGPETTDANKGIKLSRRKTT